MTFLKCNLSSPVAGHLNFPAARDISVASGNFYAVAATRDINAVVAGDFCAFAAEDIKTFKTGDLNATTAKDLNDWPSENSNGDFCVSASEDQTFRCLKSQHFANEIATQSQIARLLQQIP
jgi:hypothetical protein